MPTTHFAPGSNSVRILAPNGSWGHGVRLDNERLLTAAHVVDEHAEGTEFKVIDLFGREAGSATVVKRGHREHVDLALLAATPSTYAASLATTPLCEEDATPGEELAVTFDAIEHKTHASFDFVTRWQGRAYSTATEAFYSRGISGAGVYSKRRSCLVGIVSRQERWGGGDTGKCLSDSLGEKPSDKACAVTMGTVFVSAEDIRNFMRR